MITGRINNEDEKMYPAFEKALQKGYSFEEAANISGYASILDENGLNDLRILSDTFKEAENILKMFEENPELDRNLLNPLKEFCNDFLNKDDEERDA